MIKKDDLVLEINLSNLTREGDMKLQALSKKAKKAGNNSFWISMNDVSVCPDGIYIEGLGGILFDSKTEMIRNATLKGVNIRRVNGKWSMFLFVDSNSAMFSDVHFPNAKNEANIQDMTKSNKSLCFIEYELNIINQDWLKKLKTFAESLGPNDYYVSMDKVNICNQGIIFGGVLALPFSPEALMEIRSETIIGIYFSFSDNRWKMLLRVEP